MDISYETTKEDALAIIPFTMRNSPNVSKSQKRLRIISIVGSAVVLFAAIALWFLDEKEFAIIAAIVAILLYPYMRFFNSLMVKSYTRALSKIYDKKPSALITKHRLSISAGGIKDITDMGETLIHWPVVAQLQTNDQYLFIIGRGINGAIIPKRAFPGEAEFQAFVSEANNLFQEYGANQGQKSTSKV